MSCLFQSELSKRQLCKKGFLKCFFLCAFFLRSFLLTWTLLDLTERAFWLAMLLLLYGNGSPRIDTSRRGSVYNFSPEWVPVLGLYVGSEYDRVFRPKIVEVSSEESNVRFLPGKFAAASCLLGRGIKSRYFFSRWKVSQYLFGIDNFFDTDSPFPCSILSWSRRTLGNTLPRRVTFASSKFGLVLKFKMDSMELCTATSPLLLSKGLCAVLDFSTPISSRGFWGVARWVGLLSFNQINLSIRPFNVDDFFKLIVSGWGIRLSSWCGIGFSDVCNILLVSSNRGPCAVQSLIP